MNEEILKKILDEINEIEGLTDNLFDKIAEIFKKYGYDDAKS